MKKVFNITAGLGGIALSVLMMIVIFIISALYQGGIMSYFGFTYESISSYFIFFLVCYIVCIPVDLLAQALPRVFVIMESFKSMHSFGYIALFVGIEIIGYSIVMVIAESLMASISAPGLALVAGALGMAIIDAWLDYLLPDYWLTDEVMKEFTDFK